jgi:predicted peroxiredoxin
MGAVKFAAFALALAVAPLAIPAAFAGDTDPLFVSAVSDEPHRAVMAFTFAEKFLKRKHPVTIFLNDKAVMVASKTNAEMFKEPQRLLASLMSAGATVIVCPMCMKHYKVKEADLLPGIKQGNPEVVGAALFKDNTKTLTW